MIKNKGEMVRLEKILLLVVVLIPFVLLITPLHDILIFNISIIAWLPLLLLFLVPVVGIYVALSDTDYGD